MRLAISPSMCMLPLWMRMFPRQWKSPEQSGNVSVLVEEETGKSIDVMSLGYNRLMNHVRYMVAQSHSWGEAENESE